MRRVILAIAVAVLLLCAFASMAMAVPSDDSSADCIGRLSSTQDYGLYPNSPGNSGQVHDEINAMKTFLGYNPIGYAAQHNCNQR